MLLVGGVGVLSVMLISFSDRRYEIGLRKAMGASDGQILVQFLLEALVLAALGASVGTLGGSGALQGAVATSSPTAWSSTRSACSLAWVIALRAGASPSASTPRSAPSRLSPMEAMR